MMFFFLLIQQSNLPTKVNEFISWNLYFLSTFTFFCESVQSTLFSPCYSKCEIEVIDVPYYWLPQIAQHVIVTVSCHQCIMRSKLDRFCQTHSLTVKCILQTCHYH